MGSGTEGQISLEEALAANPDLAALLEQGKSLYSAMKKESDALEETSSRGSAGPSAGDPLFRAQIDFARHLDLMLAKHDGEEDGLRKEIVRAIYAELMPVWQATVLQLHMSRMHVKRPGRVHEQILAEATALYQKVSSQPS